MPHHSDIFINAARLNTSKTITVIPRTPLSSLYELQIKHKQLPINTLRISIREEYLSAAKKC